MKIVVTTDGSERSLTVLPHAGAFARATGAVLLLTRVHDPAKETGENLEGLLARWDRELAAWAAEAGVEATPTVAILGAGEDVATAISRTARENQAGLFAMASEGAGALHHALLGSVAMAVVGQSGLPVLVVTGEAGEVATPDHYRLVITSDGSEESTHVITELAPLLEGSPAEVVILHVYEPRLGDAGERFEIPLAEKRLDELRTLLPANLSVTISVAPVHELERVENAILRLAREARADAIALSTHGHSARCHLFAGSIALAILKKSHLPVILARR